MKTFFTSDLHLGHSNIIRYSGRPYLIEGDLAPDGKWLNRGRATAAALRMDADVIEKYNQVVGPDDVVYNLGDFSFGSSKEVIQYLRKLNGKIFFIWGNHDQGMKAYKAISHFYDDLKGKVTFLGDMANVNVEGQEIVLNHYAMRVWERSHYGAWHLYGHSHGSLPDDPHSLSFDVGIDCHNMKVLTFQEVKDIMEKKLFRPIDHHGAKAEGGGIDMNKEDYAKADRLRQYEQLKKEFEV